MFTIGWFSTGRDEAARQLLTTVKESIDRGEITAQIAFVFSNREPGEAPESDLFFNLVQVYGIPLIYFSSRRFRTGFGPSEEMSAREPWRLEYDRQVMKRLQGFQPELCVLAGYMLIVGEEMCRRYPMINLHPAAPGGPTGTWQEVIWKLIEARASATGGMMHLVTPELDKGPPVTYCTFSLRGEPFDRHWAEMEGYSMEELKRKPGEASPLFRLIRQWGLAREFPLIIATLKAFSQGKVRIEGGVVVDSFGNPIGGYDLTKEIDRMVG